MIRLTRLNGVEVVVNADLIEFVETTPDTLVTLLTGKKIPVRESTEDVIDKVVSYRRATGPAVVTRLADPRAQSAKED